MLNIKGATRALALAAVLGTVQATAGAAALVNGGFENPAFASQLNYATDTATAGWRTTASDHQIEYWGHSFQGVAAYEGTQFVELNANMVSTLYQDVSSIAAGSQIGFEFAHRGRAGTDTMRLTITDLGANNAIGGGDDTVLFQQSYSDGNTAWGFYTNATALTALGHDVRFAYESVASVGGSSVGNFLDAVAFGVGAGNSAVPEPTSIALSLLGLAGVGLSRRKARKTAASTRR